MYYFAIFICLVITVVIGIMIPKKPTYTKLDRLGVVFNVVLGALYIPLSLIGVMSVFAADSINTYSQSLQMFVKFLICCGVMMPFISLFGIGLSIVFRKEGKTLPSFVVQFIPLAVFLIMFISFGFIYL